jgi:hypothetical protein
MSDEKQPEWAKALEDLKAKHGDNLTLIEVDDAGAVYELIVLTPTKGEWNKLSSDLAGTEDPARKRESYSNFIQAVTKWPERPEVKAFLDRKFGSIGGIANEIGKLVGTDAVVRSKKL